MSQMNPVVFLNCRCLSVIAALASLLPAKENRAYHLSTTFHHYRLYFPVDNTTICDIVDTCLTINTKT